MVHLRSMVHEGWYMVQELKLWYDYIIMVNSGNAGRTNQTLTLKRASLGGSPYRVPINETHSIRDRPDK